MQLLRKCGNIVIITFAKCKPNKLFDNLISVSTTIQANRVSCIMFIWKYLSLWNIHHCNAVEMAPDGSEIQIMFRSSVCRLVTGNTLYRTFLEMEWYYWYQMVQPSNYFEWNHCYILHFISAINCNSLLSPINVSMLYGSFR